MLPDLGLLLCLGAGGGLGASIVLLVAALRGFDSRDGLPPPRWVRLRDGLRSPAVAGRLVAAAAVGALTLAFTRWPVGALGAAALVVGGPHLFGGAGAERRVIAQQEALLTWTETVRDAIRGGVALAQAIPDSAQRAPLLLREPLLLLRGRLRSQVPLEAALRTLAQTLDEAGADLVIALLIQASSQSWDELPASLSILVAAARHELEAARETSAGRAGLRRGVQIILLVSVLVAGYFLVFARPYVVWYATAPGQLVLALELALIGAGLIWLRALAGAPQHRARFLSGPAGEDPAGQRIVAALSVPDEGAGGLRPLGRAGR